MTFAVVGILGHFSKTILLFFIPQILNFLYSVPQLFHLIPCPRHRIPKLNENSNKLEVSVTVFRLSELNSFSYYVIKFYKLFRIIEWDEKHDYVVTNNLTLINYVLLILGPMHENKLTMILLCFQIVASLIAFTIRYPLATLFYET